MARRAALFVVPLMLMAMALPGQAASRPQVVDPSGDAVGAQASTDIVSATFSTTGRGSRRSYRPAKLVVTLTLAAPPVTTPGVTYEVGATTTTCGELDFTYEPGTVYGAAFGAHGWAHWGDCGNALGERLELLSPTVTGNTVIWSLPLNNVKKLTLGTVFSDFEARVDPTNPVLPLASRDFGTEFGLVDLGTGTGTWKLG